MQRFKAVTLVSTFSALLTLSVFSGCATSTVSSTYRLGTDQLKQPIIIPPDSNLLADAIGVELFQKGFDVATADRARTLLRKSQERPRGEVEESGPVVLIVKSSGYTAFSGVPESAVVKLVTPHGGSTISAVNWQTNDDLGLSSVGLVDAAKQIAGELVAGIMPSNDQVTQN